MSELMGQEAVIEGLDGTGKSLQVKLFREKLWTRKGIESIEYAEPAMDPKDGIEDVLIADALRAVIKNGNLKRDPITNLFMFSGARHEVREQKVKPALKLGKTAVSARNYWSTEAYQGYGEGLPLDLIYDVTLKATDEKYMKPDIAVILNLEDELERQRRIDNRGELENPDTFESRGQDFQMRVNAAYLDIARRYNIPVVSAAGTPEEVSERIWEVVEPHTRFTF